MTESARAGLVAILRLAYSGERAAALAYQGHARSVADPSERKRIGEIEAEEWHHRRLLGEMLSALGTRPSRAREVRALLLGTVLKAGCHVAGWLAPMYGAGKLESRNIREYEAAARLARNEGHAGWADCLLTMAEVEWEHEAYFRSKVLSHPWRDRIPIWPPPPPKGEIRESFRRDTER